MTASDLPIIISDLDDKEIFDHLVAMLEHPAGYQVVLFGYILAAYRLENGKYVVVEDNKTEIPYDNAADAIRYFLFLRAQKKLGFDYDSGRRST